MTPPAPGLRRVVLLALRCAVVCLALTAVPDHVCGQVPGTKRELNALMDTLRRVAGDPRRSGTMAAAAAMSERVAAGMLRVDGREKRRYAEWLHIAATVRAGVDAGLHPERADSLFAAAEQVYAKLVPARDTVFAGLAMDRAELWTYKPDLERMEFYAERAVRLYTDALGPNNRQVANALLRLGEVAQYRQDWVTYGELTLRAAAIFEAGTREKDQLRLEALVLRAQAAYYLSMPAAADSLGRLALKHPAAGARRVWLLPLRAQIAAADGRIDSAIQLRREQLDIAYASRTEGTFTPQVIEAAQHLAALYWNRGDYARADSMFGRLLTESGRPSYPPAVRAAYMASAATFYGEVGDVAKGAAMLAQADSLFAVAQTRLMAQGSEGDKRRIGRMTRGVMDATVRFGTAYASPATTRLAATAVLRRKGADLDILADQIAAAREGLTAGDRALFDAWVRARAELATRALARDSAPPGRETDSLAGLVRDLGTTLARRHQSAAGAGERATLTGVQAVLPSGATLIEYTRYDVPSNPRLPDPLQPMIAHYAAYVLRPTGEPKLVALGPAAPIDSAIAAFHASLHDPADPHVRERARAVYDRILRPLRPHLAGAELLLIAPDGDLNLVPFAALADEHGHYLVQDHTVALLTSGRDVLRLQAPAPAGQRPLIIADVDYGAAGVLPHVGPRSQPSGRRSAGTPGADWLPLPGTDQELERIREVLSPANELTKTDATEVALVAYARTAAPVILHVATHGFFLPARPTAQKDVRTTAPAFAAGRLGGMPVDENPLLRSGLALAGANARNDGMGGDGILTALEASTLNLAGTQLVVLSACETGLGEVGAGEGVYGFRRALVLAGTRSQLMSLWRVNDRATAELMADYYARLRKGEGRAAALRAVQVDMLRDPERQHPYYWASFVPIGDWRPLPGTREPLQEQRPQRRRS